ncbi:MAG TPA: M14 family metallopeptidase [Candidatus Competibacteraceae bacterium]|nr:M14 family metallopeptidase [Candidatus Competibacteraceae bacterium]
MNDEPEIFYTLPLPFGAALPLWRRCFGTGPGPRVAVTAGIHGDELEGVYLCHRLAAWLEALEQRAPEALRGRIELYPALNPTALDGLRRTIPGCETDLNRSFPGHPQGLPAQRLAHAVLQALDGCDLVVDVHASNRYLQELPQVRIEQRWAETLLPLARVLGLPLIWVHGAVNILESSLASNLNRRATPCLLLELGNGDSHTPAYAESLCAGLLRLWRHLGVLDDESEQAGPASLLAGDDDIQVVHSDSAGGLFLPTVQVGERVFAGQSLGRIVSPLRARPLAETVAPSDGLLFTLRRAHPVPQGTLLARIVTDTEVRP